MANKFLIVSPEEFKRAMQAFSDGTDTERDHGDADALMCQILESLGYGEGVKIFRKMGKWYA